MGALVSAQWLLQRGVFPGVVGVGSTGQEQRGSGRSQHPTPREGLMQGPQYPDSNNRLAPHLESGYQTAEGEAG